MQPSKTVKIAIADDHRIFRDGLKLLFKKVKHIELVGEAANGSELIEIAKVAKPDVILTDIVMPVVDGIEAVKHILSLQLNVGIIALSMFDEENLVIDILEAGALGFLMKNAEKDEILAAIEAVVNGQPYYCSAISTILSRLICTSKFNPYKGYVTPLFSDKEIQIIQAICEEFTSKEIADKLFCSIRTVEWHKANIMQKMHVKSSTGIVIYAIKNNIYKIKRA